VPGADGGGSAGDVVAGGVAGFAVAGDAGCAGTDFGGGRSGPLMPQAVVPAARAAAIAARSAHVRMD